MQPETGSRERDGGGRGWRLAPAWEGGFARSFRAGVAMGLGQAFQGGQTSQMRAGRAVPQNTGPQESVAGVAVVGGEVVSFGCQAE